MNNRPGNLHVIIRAIAIISLLIIVIGATYGCEDDGPPHSVIEKAVWDKLNKGHKIQLNMHGQPYVGFGDYYRGQKDMQANSVKVLKIDKPYKVRFFFEETEYWPVWVTISGSGYSVTDELLFNKNEFGQWETAFSGSFGWPF